jgi:hypothetical protein
LYFCFKGKGKNMKREGERRGELASNCSLSLYEEKK